MILRFNNKILNKNSKLPSFGNYPSIIKDGNTVAWYAYDNLSTLTRDSNNLLSRWNDKLGSGRDLIQSNGSYQPLWTEDGVLFDGIDNVMSMVTTFDDPCMMYVVMEWVGIGGGSYLISGNYNHIIGRYGTQTIAIANSNYLTPDISLPYGKLKIVRALFNYANSKFSVNTTTTSGNLAGTFQFTQLNIGANGGIGNIKVKEFILRKVADTPENETNIYNYLKKKYFSYTDILNDGNTKAWYDYNDLNTITKDSGNLVSVWKDKLNSGRDLIQLTGSTQPMWTPNGVLFDGIDNYMATAPFTYNQPEMIYIVFNQISWTVWDFIFDGYNVYGGGLTQNTTGSNIALYAGQFPVVHAENNNLSLNTFGIIRVLFSGSNSKIQVNGTTPTTGDFGISKNMGGFVLGKSWQNAYWSNIQVKEVILRSVADTQEDENIIYNYLRNKYFPYPSVLYDGSTVALYDYKNGATRDSNNLVSKWSDVLGSGRDLLQSNGSYQPTWNSEGILFDGVDNYMKTGVFTWNQPITMYFVINLKTWTLIRCIFDGATTDSIFLFEFPAGSGNLQLRSSSAGPTVNVNVGTYIILRLTINDLTSKITVNNQPSVSSASGSVNTTAFTLGSRGGDGLNNSHIEVKEVILRNVADTPANENIIYNYLKNKYNL